jgi:hypothetical protein
VRVLDAVDVRADTFRRALAGGITTVNVMPGSGHLMSGQTLYLKLRASPHDRRLAVLPDPRRHVCGGMKMANGTNSRSASRPSPAPAPSRRRWCASCSSRRRTTRRKWQPPATTPRQGPRATSGMEALLEVLDGKRIVHTTPTATTTS